MLILKDEPGEVDQSRQKISLKVITHEENRNMFAQGQTGRDHMVRPSEAACAIDQSFLGQGIKYRLTASPLPKMVQQSSLKDDLYDGICTG